MSKLSYQSSGVNIKLGDKASKDAFYQLQKTFNSSSQVQDGIVALKTDFTKFKKPLLALSCDGVGTKLKYALALGKHDTIGIDLVAMSVNDLVRNNIHPYAFALYRATGKIDLKIMHQVVKGVVKGCLESGCVYTTGETAEMPGFYQNSDYDLAGFAIGVFDKDQLITGKNIKEGDTIFGLPSSGFHSNGYSLIRKVFPPEKIKNNKKLINSLIKPTKIYVDLVLDLNNRFNILGWAHITGSGIAGKLAKIIPDSLQAELVLKSWPVPQLMQEVTEKGKLNLEQISETFNMGLGMIGVCKEKDINSILNYLKSKNEKVYLIGKIKKRKGKKIIFI